MRTIIEDKFCFKDSSNKSDAFKVMFNGDTTVSNDLTVSGDVVIVLAFSYRMLAMHLK